MGKRAKKKANSLQLPKMKMIAISIILTLAMFVGKSEASVQCDCANYYYSAYDEMQKSAAVFVGEVVEVKKVKKDHSDDYDFEVTFKVLQAWKAKSSETILVKNKSLDKSVFEKGKRYLVYARLQAKFLYAYMGCCTRTKLLEDAERDLREFEEHGAKPQQQLVPLNQKVQP